MKNEQKKTATSNYGISVGFKGKDSDIELLGASPENLKLANSWINEDLGFALEDVIPEDTVFLYKIELFDEKPERLRTTIQGEIGVGKLVKQDKKNILQRLLPLQKCKYSGSWFPSNSQTPKEFPEQFLVVTSYAPKSIGDLFSIENTVICSLGNGRPELVPLEDGSVLGSINGDIRSATVQELFLATDLPLSTNSSSFQLNGKNSLFLANSLTLKSTRSRPPNPQPGTIVYNSRKKAFEGFNGEVWKTLKWED